MSEALFDDGEAYERLMGRWSQRVAAIFLDWLNVPRGLHWLDVGCGNGAFTEALIARCVPAGVTAIDPSDDQLAYARTRPGAKTADFRTGNAQGMPFTDSVFDGAIMALVISFLPEPNKAVAEMARVVRPGGWVAAYMWDIPGGGVPSHPIYLALEGMGMTAARPPNPEVSAPSAMTRIWEGAGLVSVETTVIRIRTIYSEFEDYWESNVVPVGPQGKLIAGMSAASKKELRAQLQSRLPTLRDGRVVFDSFANAVKGRNPG